MSDVAPARFLLGLLLGFTWSCMSDGAVAPVILYPGPEKPQEEIAVLQVARTGEARGAPSLNIRRITRLEPDPEVLYRVEAGTVWTPPEHFGGLQATQSQRPTEDPNSLPDHFELPPGTYRVEFLYVPLLGRWGETHRAREGSTLRLDCEAGRVYRLKGSLDPAGHRFFITTAVMVAGSG